MNCSMDGTSSFTSLSIVLYCESSRTHAGEYLFDRIAQYPALSARREGEGTRTHSEAETESRTYARSRYSSETMMPKSVARRPYFSRSALVV